MTDWNIYLLIYLMTFKRTNDERLGSHNPGINVPPYSWLDPTQLREVGRSSDRGRLAEEGSAICPVYTVLYNHLDR